MVVSKFYEDIEKERLFGLWLDEYFYKEFSKFYQNIERNKDEELQKKGVDVIIENLDGTKMFVDEKATLHYINKKLPTFAFEILNRSSGARGWLFHPDYQTNLYLLAWPEGEEIISGRDSFSASEIMIIKRDDIIDLLEKRGLSEEKIRELVKKYESGDENKIKVKEGISLNFNRFLRETPVNIVISKKILMQVRCKHYRVYRDGNKIEEIKKYPKINN